LRHVAQRHNKITKETRHFFHRLMQAPNAMVVLAVRQVLHAEKYCGARATLSWASCFIASPRVPASTRWVASRDIEPGGELLRHYGAAQWLGIMLVHTSAGVGA
jgi:hypothetical protein